MCEYTAAALVGSVIDRHGPSICSFIAACLFSCGFGVFAFQVHNASRNLPGSSQTSFRFLFCAGWPWHCVFVHMTLPCFKSSINGYFSALFAASKSIPNHIGLASGASMALFSLSPLFLSAIATIFFCNSPWHFAQVAIEYTI